MYLTIRQTMYDTKDKGISIFTGRMSPTSMYPDAALIRDTVRGKVNISRICM